MTHQKATYPRIFLIRHGKPLVSDKGFFDHRRAAQFFADYDAAGVEQFDRILADVDFSQPRQVHCSTLQRAKSTAQMLFGEQMPLVENAMFREFERKALKLPFLRLPIKWWQVLTRVLWLLGLNSNGIEPFAEARKRAAVGAGVLAAEARKEGMAVLVAHGFLIRFLVRALKQQGWKGLKKADRGFLGVYELVLEV